MPRKKTEAELSEHKGNEREIEANKPAHLRGRRSYGGKAGVWIKKKCLVLVKDSSQDFSMDGSLAAAVRESVTSELLVQPEPVRICADNAEERSQKRRSILRVVGWDEELCRPVYKNKDRICSAKFPLDIFGSKDSKDDGAEGDDYYSGLSPPSQMVAAEKSIQNAVEKKYPFKKVVRSYGGRWKNRSLSVAATAIVEDCGNSSVLSSTKRQNIVGNTPMGKQIIFSNSPEEATASTDDFTRSPLAEISTLAREKEMDRKEAAKALSGIIHVSNYELDLGGQNRAKRKTFQQPNFSTCPEVSKASSEIIHLSNDEFDFREPSCSKAKTFQQPNFSTCPAVAKAYFDQLDARHKLSVETGDDPDEGRRRAVVRTTRSRSHEENSKLASEYDGYCKSASEGGVTPIAMKDFVTNKHIYFRKTIDKPMHDGLLDDDI